MRYITTKNLGYNQEQIIVVDNQAGWGEQASKTVDLLRNHFQNNSMIADVAGANVSVNKGWSRTLYKSENGYKLTNAHLVDHHYVPLLDLQFVEGRNFAENQISDSTSVIVNEAFVRKMGWKSPLDEYVYLKGRSGAGYKVIGVLKDYHYQSLEQTIEPIILMLDESQLGYLTYTLIKTNPGHTGESLEVIRKAFNKLFPDRPFVYSFMEDDVARQYENYERWMNITCLSTSFAIIIACLGLFGLAGINAVNRTKEVGIRKVMGAGVANIFVLLNKQYVWLSLIAYTLAIPFSWYIMKQWLSNFQFKITMGVELFLLAMGLGIIVALLTVSYHAIKASLINPADTLKHE